MNQRHYIGLSFLVGLIVLGPVCYSPECVTDCGLTIDNTPWTCEDIQRAETNTLKAFENTNDPRLTKCGNLRLFRVETKSEPNFIDLDELVSGRTYCDDHRIVIGNSEPSESALPHEIAHVLQECRRTTRMTTFTLTGRTVGSMRRLSLWAVMKKISLLLALVFMSCGRECVNYDDGVLDKYNEFAIGDLNKLYFDCRTWTKRQYIDASGVHDYWWCESWIKEE